MSNIAIIPARSGSKRIPRKNIKLFCGKPIVAYSIEVAIQSNLFDEIMVSTDDEEIAIVAQGYGAKVPFFRSEKNSDDFATTIDVIKEVIESYKKRGDTFKYGCCIYPTAPFISNSLVNEAFRKLFNNKFDSLFPVLKYSYPIWRSLKMENEKISMWWPENLNKRSQDLPASYHDAGQFYWFNVERTIQSGSLLSNNTGAIIVDELHVHDIDTQQDWETAEFKYLYLQGLRTDEQR
jgi:pseudaminic acid cytidylyltransferase